MSNITVLNKNFAPTWKKIEPYLRLKNVSTAAEWKILNTAQKAVYAFICSVVNGLNLQIRALDEENEVNGDVGGSPWIADFNKGIKEALDTIRYSKKDGAIDMAVVNSQMEVLKKAGEEIMTHKIGWGWKCWVFICPSCC